MTTSSAAEWPPPAVLPLPAAKRAFDVAAAALALLLVAPVLAVAALGIRLSSRGPLLYRARRIGRGGREYAMYKFRSMHVDQGAFRSVITAHNDPRVFRWGAILRKLKIDELPQLLNILKGDMTVVGPRPEDPCIVAQHYTPAQREVLGVRPGLTSPGSLFNYTHGEATLADGTAEDAYVRKVMPVRIALDLVYVRSQSFWYDLMLILRTAWSILALNLGRHSFALPPEFVEAQRILEAQRRAGAKAEFLV